MTDSPSDVLTSPIVIAIARPDGTGEVLVDCVSHAGRAPAVDEARQDCFGYVFHEVVQSLGQRSTRRTGPRRTRTAWLYATAAVAEGF